MVACGAIAAPIRAIALRRSWPIELHSLSALLHNHPSRIAAEVECLAIELAKKGSKVAVAYADCGSYGALDQLCDRLGLARLPGLSCYDLFAGPDRIAELMAQEPGTYLLTDFLVRSFRRTVITELGLDRHPELVTDYFGNYTRVVWLTQNGDLELGAEAQAIADLLGLELVVEHTGLGGLELALGDLVDQAGSEGAAR